MESDDNPMSSAHAAPRCAAHSKRTRVRCQGPAVAGWNVCRYHGAGGGHPAGPSHPSWRHGLRSRSHVQMRRVVSQMVREAREISALLDDGRTLP